MFVLRRYTMGYKGLGYAIGLASITGLILLAAALLAPSGGADAPEIRGVDRAALEKEGFHLGPPSGKGPKITAEEAKIMAGSPAQVQEIVLASLEREPGIHKGNKRDVWAISYDPATVQPISGGLPDALPGRPSRAPQPTFSIAYAVDFVDAQTGEFIVGVQQAGPPR
jgi:hypothetical protein